VPAQKKVFFPAWHKLHSFVRSFARILFIIWM
jgi:hypothetical protein